jgi:hypothetical protein
MSTMRMKRIIKKQVNETSIAGVSAVAATLISVPEPATVQLEPLDAAVSAAQ